jgi:mono/diheme cytochrome c family protein
MRLAAILACLASMCGCRQSMNDEPRYKPLAESDFFQDGQSARPLIEDTVARGHLHTDQLLYAGKQGKNDAETFPFAVTIAVLERGRERFQIFCTPCHGILGNGDGPVVERGFRGPPSYHIDRLRKAPVGHFFDVVTNGYGAMASYASRIPPRDRWAIIAYIRALQLSQNATPADVPPGELNKLQGDNR